MAAFTLLLYPVPTSFLKSSAQDMSAGDSSHGLTYNQILYLHRNHITTSHARARVEIKKSRVYSTYIFWLLVQKAL